MEVLEDFSPVYNNIKKKKNKNIKYINKIFICNKYSKYKIYWVYIYKEIWYKDKKNKLRNI